MQAIALGARLGKELIPFIWRMAALQHFPEYSIGIIVALVGALGVFVVNPCKDDHLAWSVIAKEESVLLKKLGTKPMPVAFTNGIALSVFRSSRILRNNFKREFRYRCQTLAGIFFRIPDRIFLLKCLDL